PRRPPCGASALAEPAGTPPAARRAAIQRRTAGLWAERCPASQTSTRSIRATRSGGDRAVLVVERVLGRSFPEERYLGLQSRLQWVRLPFQRTNCNVFLALRASRAAGSSRG